MNKDLMTGLTTAKEKRQLTALYRDELSQVSDYSGIPVVLGRQLVVLARETDFSLDGYVALRLADVTFLEQVDDAPFIRKLAEGEGLYQKAQPPKLADGDSWQGLVGGIKAGWGGWMTAETVDDEGSCFLMGVLSRLDSTYLYLHQVDADGTRRQEETTVPLQDLVTVTFGGRYVELYRKYTK